MMGDNGGKGSQYGWREVRQETLVRHVRFDSAMRRGHCGTLARRDGYVYEQADGGKPFRWEFVEREPNTGDPRKDTRSIDGGRTHSAERAIEYCDNAYRKLLEEKGPLGGDNDDTPA